VPDQILIAFVPKLPLYGIGCHKDRFPEFLKTLENGIATALAAARMGGANELEREGIVWDRGGKMAKDEPAAIDGIAGPPSQTLPAR
jgi:hypothetical protein